MFFGTYTPRLDEKGRLILPAKFRNRFAEGLVVTKGQEHCLYVFPMDEFTRIHQALSQAPSGSKQVRDFIRFLLAGASDELPDKQGRITIPPPLRQYASLDRDCVVLGVGNRVEIWDAPSWEKYQDDNEDEFSTQAQEVVPGLF